MTTPEPKRADLLNSLRACLYSDANYDAALDVIRGATIEKWQRPDESLSARDSLELRCLAAEVLDYAGQYRLAAEVIGDSGHTALDILASNSSFTDQDSPLLYRQQIWMAIHWGYVHYRGNHFDEASDIFRECERAVLRLVEVQYPCSGTMARIKYSQGLIHRERADYTYAKECFFECVKHSWAYLERMRLTRSSQSVVADFHLAKALALGLAWVHRAEGHLALAMPLLLAAKAILRRHRHAELIDAYVDVIYASVLRLRSRQPGVLEDVIRKLEEAYRVFLRREHSTYTYRAAHELALAYIQKGQSIPAIENRTDAHNAARSYLRILSHDHREGMHGIVYLLEARIARDSDDPEHAREYAKLALDETSKVSARYGTAVKVDALVVLGEAHLQQNNSDAALKRFLEAYDLAATNPFVMGRTLLFIAIAHARAGQVRETLNAWQRWEALKPQIESASVLALEQRAQNELKPITENFILRLSDDGLDKDTIIDVQDFLLRWARSRTKTKKEAAEILGISPQTCYNWERACAKRKKMSATKSTSVPPFHQSNKR